MPVPVGPDAAGAAAISFADGAWHAPWPGGTIADHRGENHARVPVTARAAAFSPDGAILAVLTPEGDEIVLVDRATGAVRSRLTLPRQARGVRAPM